MTQACDVILSYLAIVLLVFVVVTSFFLYLSLPPATWLSWLLLSTLQFSTERQKFNAEKCFASKSEMRDTLFTLRIICTHSST